jgi:hypothetical protein
MTASGLVAVQRVYFKCQSCVSGEYALDARLGIAAGISRQARRIVTLAGASWSFAAASFHLEELCGLSLSHEWIRSLCDQESRRIETWSQESPAATQKFRQAQGNIEFQTDGTSVNTQDGWREMRLGIVAKRPAGEPAAADEWDTRKLPAPTARTAFAAIEDSETFASRWRGCVSRLGIVDTSQVTVLADGAEWIWKQSNIQLPGARGLLDIYHAIEHLSDTSKKLYGEGNSDAADWTNRGREALLTKGWSGLCDHLQPAMEAKTSPADRQPLEQLIGYFSKQIDHLDYASRLQSGESIGSGMVEGAAKTVIGRRLKQSGARWVVQRANRMANLCCTLYSEIWQNYWAEPINAKIA